MIPEEWTRVRIDHTGVGVVAVRVESLASGGFLLHTREPHGEFDVWLESEEEVHSSLVDFDLDTGTLPTTSTTTTTS